MVLPWLRECEPKKRAMREPVFCCCMPEPLTPPWPKEREGVWPKEREGRVPEAMPRPPVLPLKEREPRGPLYDT